MVRLYRLTTGIFTVLALTLLMERNAANVTLSPSLFSMIFTNPDGSPCHRSCMFGVYPGQMTDKDATARIKAHPFTRTMFNAPSDSPTDAIFMNHEFTIGYRQNTAHPWIEISPNDQDPEDPAQNNYSLGEAIRHYGPPDCVLVRDKKWFEAFYLSKGFKLVYRLTQPDRISPDDQALDNISVFSTPDADASDQDLRPWRGFASLDLYQQTPGCPATSAD